jgi:hypothetical protein
LSGCITGEMGTRYSRFLINKFVIPPPIPRKKNRQWIQQSLFKHNVIPKWFQEGINTRQKSYNVNSVSVENKTTNPPHEQ